MAFVSHFARPAALDFRKEARSTRRIGMFLISALTAVATVALQAGPAHAAAPIGQAAVKQRTIVLAGGEQRGVAVPCPTGQRIVGGGVGTFDSVNSKILVSGPLDGTGLTAKTDDGDIARFWYAAVYNRGPIPRAYRVFALCSTRSDAIVEATTVDVSLQATNASGFVMCPAGTRAVGGGIGTTHPVIDRPQLRDATWQLMHNGPLDGTGTTADTTTGDIARFWYASLHKFHDGPATRYKVFALCSRTSTATIAAASMNVPAHSVGSTFVGCPVNQVVTGGGVGTPATPVKDYLQVSGPLDGTGLTENTIDGHTGVFWYGSVFNASATVRPYKVFALCASVT
jgi:hypothetical protein